LIQNWLAQEGKIRKDEIVGSEELGLLKGRRLTHAVSAQEYQHWSKCKTGK
jgi:hypothetical protein